MEENNLLCKVLSIALGAMALFALVPGVFLLLHDELSMGLSTKELFVVTGQLIISLGMLISCVALFFRKYWAVNLLLLLLSIILCLWLLEVTKSLFTGDILAIENVFSFFMVFLPVSCSVYFLLKIKRKKGSVTEKGVGDK